MAKWLIFLGLILVAAGLLWALLEALGLGRLPGDITIKRGNFRLYIPLGTSILISLVLSLVLSLIFWFLNR